MDLSKSKKISVVGNSAAGKSTFSHKLGLSLGLDVFSIDKIYWLAGWRQQDPVVFKRLHDHWLRRDSWIIDGVGYWAEMTRRFVESDCVIFMDVPMDVCKARAETRIKQEQLTENMHITAGCAYRDAKALQMEVIENFHHELRPRLLAYLSGFSAEKIRVTGDLDGVIF